MRSTRTSIDGGATRPAVESRARSDAHVSFAATVLGVLGGALAVGVVASLGDRFALAIPAAAIPRGGATFSQPDVLASAGGRLAVTLVAAPSKVAFGSGKRFAYTYNGTTPGPTLRVRPGDVLSITLVNRLGETTNLHTHGLHVSPSGQADNVFIAIPNGGRHTYVYEIPSDHRSGTFWYHPHMHEMVAPQVFGGLAGAIIVEDALDQLPELATATERILVLSDPAIGNSSSILNASMMDRMRGREGDVVVVNGVVAPTIAAQAGQLEHWRIVNASPSRYYRLSLEAHPFTVIGTDGGRLATPRDASEILLAPGERAETLVAASVTGSYRLDALPYDRGTTGTGMGGGGSAETTTRALVATMTTAGTAPPAAMPTALAPASALALPAPTSQRQLVLAMGMGGGGMGGGGSGRSFTIDGETFDPARTDIKTKLGRVEDWTITNVVNDGPPFPPSRLAFSSRRAHRRRADHTRMERHGERSRRRIGHGSRAPHRHQRSHRVPLPHPRPRRPRNDGCHPRRVTPRQAACRFRLDDGALEEVGVQGPVALQGVGEHVLPKGLVVEDAVLDELVGLGERLGEVGDVPVTDVGTHDRGHASPERRGARIERNADERIVGFAAPVEVAAEAVADVFDRVDAREREVVAAGLGGWRHAGHQGLGCVTARGPARFRHER